MAGNNFGGFDSRRFERRFEVSRGGISHRSNDHFQNDASMLMLPASASNCLPGLGRGQYEAGAPGMKNHAMTGRVALPAIHNLTTFADHQSPSGGRYAYVADSGTKPFQPQHHLLSQMRDSPITEDASTATIDREEHQKRAEFWNTVMSQDHPIPHVSLSRSRRDDSEDDQKKGKASFPF